jgi:hypothetical protein
MVITIVSERLATRSLGRWTYSELMPVVPVLGVGLVPVIRWLGLNGSGDFSRQVRDFARRSHTDHRTRRLRRQVFISTARPPVALRLPIQRLDVIRAAALLLVLTLTGTPIAALACVGLCGQPPTRGSQAACHDDYAASVEDLNLSAWHRCDRTLLDAPVVVTKTQRLLQAPTRLATMLPALLSVHTPAGVVSGQVTPAYDDLPLGAHSSHAILRI